jgi:hypothetical protein
MVAFEKDQFWRFAADFKTQVGQRRVEDDA